MGFSKEANADSAAKVARRAREEGRTVLVFQFRGALSHAMTGSGHPVGGVAEMIEAVEAEGWRVDHMNSMPYKDNMSIVCLFRPAPRTYLRLTGQAA